MDTPMMVRVFVSDGAKVAKSYPGVVVSGPNGNNPTMASARVFRDEVLETEPAFENKTDTTGPVPAFKPLTALQRERAAEQAGVWMEGEAFFGVPANSPGTGVIPKTVPGQ